MEKDDIEINATILRLSEQLIKEKELILFFNYEGQDLNNIAIMLLYHYTFCNDDNLDMDSYFEKYSKDIIKKYFLDKKEGIKDINL